MKHHTRVIPRDFFNEAKLLKCLGKLELYINHEGPNDIGLKSEFDNEPFNIFQNPNDGSLSVLNYKVYLGDEEIQLFVNYNDKGAWPLIGLYRGETYYIFNEEGKFIPNFGVVK